MAEQRKRISAQDRERIKASYLIGILGGKNSTQAAEFAGASHVTQINYWMSTDAVFKQNVELARASTPSGFRAGSGRRHVPSITEEIEVTPAMLAAIQALVAAFKEANAN